MSSGSVLLRPALWLHFPVHFQEVASPVSHPRMGFSLEKGRGACSRLAVFSDCEMETREEQSREVPVPFSDVKRPERVAGHPNTNSRQCTTLIKYHV